MKGDLTWSAEEAELRTWAAPLLESPAFQRLKGVTFLGGLSSRHWSRAGEDDGSRKDHSVGVAWLALRAAERLGFSEASKRLVIAWGLTHDIATWSLSHTSEPAFAASTGTDQRTLRRFIVSGARVLASAFVVVRVLRDIGVVSEDLLGLFNKKAAPSDREHAAFWQLINSPMSPDNLEGIWRAGVATGVEVPHPKHLINTLERGLLEPCVHSDGIGSVLHFWRAKGRVYREHINDDRSRWFESHWAHSIQHALGRVALTRSLEITEEELVRDAPPPRSEQLTFGWGELRFREPQTYTVQDEPKARADVPISTLRRHLLRRPAVQ